MGSLIISIRCFFIAVNLRRRHLDKGQRIALGIEIEPYFAEEALKRKADGGKKHDGNQYTKEKLEGSVHCPPPSKPTSSTKNERAFDKAASAVGISGKTLSAV